MNKKKILVGILFIIIMIGTNLLAIFHEENVQDISVDLHVVCDAQNDLGLQT